MAFLFSPHFQTEDGNGDPRPGAKLYFYRAGTTSAITSYQDADATTPHTSPVVADTSGLFAPIFLDTMGNYKFVLQTAAGETIQTVDKVTPGPGGPSTNFNTVALLLADTTLDYSTGANKVTAGEIITAEGYRYEVAASGASDQHVTTAGGVKLYVKTITGGWNDAKAWGAKDDDATDNTSIIQSIIDKTTGYCVVFLPGNGTYRVTGTIYLRRNGVKIKGGGDRFTRMKYVNAAGGTMFTGDTDGSASLLTYSGIELSGFEVAYSGPTTDPDVIVDLTTFSYGRFDIRAQTQRANAAIYQGQSNSGVSPYYNIITSSGLFGGDYTQTCFRFKAGVYGGAFSGSDGPNANIIGPIARAAIFGKMIVMESGLANVFSQIGGESIGDCYIQLGGIAAATATGTVTAVAQSTLAASAASFPALANGAVKMTSGAANGHVRRIASNTATSVNLLDAWAIHPAIGDTFEVHQAKVVGNKFSQVRGEGSASLNPDFVAAYPDSYKTSIQQHDAQSLGTGLFFRDATGSAREEVMGPKTFLDHAFVNPGAGANVNARERSGAIGGVPVAGRSAIEWVKVTTAGDAVDTLTVTLDHGNGSVGAGAPSIVVTIPAGSNVGVGMPAVGAKVYSTGNLFHNLTTGAGYTANMDVNITTCLALDT